MQGDGFFPEEQASTEEILARFEASPEDFWQETEQLCAKATVVPKLQAAMEQSVAGCASILRRLEQGIRDFCAKLPVRTGFFTSQASGTVFFEDFCGLMELMQAAQRSLHWQLLRMADAERLPAMAMPYRLRAELNCHAVLSCGGDAEAHAADCLERLEKDRQTADAVLCEAGKQRDAVEAFLRKTVPAFCDAAAQAADAEHGGERFRADAVSGLCGELAFEVRKLIGDW